MTRTLIGAATLAALLFAGTAGAQSYEMPLHGEDLAPGERYRTDTHAAGIQAQGRDITARRWLGDGKWSGLKSGVDADANAKNPKNSADLIYGDAIYAMEDGEVVGCWANAVENPRPKRGDEDGDMANPPWIAQDLKDGLIAGGGNHIWVLQTNGVYALYAHAIPGSIPSSVCPNRAVRFPKKVSYSARWPDVHPTVEIAPGSRPKVKKGQKLGLVGNSGSSTGPHLHVHMEKDAKPQPMNFARGMTTPIVDATDINGPWTPLKGKPLPEGKILVWPAHSLGAKLTWNGTAQGDFQRTFDHFADSSYWMDTIVCKVSNGKISYDTTWSPAKNGWFGWFGISEASYNAKKADAESKGMKETWHNICNGSHSAIFKKV
ncbi:hypothetical protein ABAC460_04420 [Asticcacaulis sp. AC460]|uniref:M23 family metallopeptidase n=1 Tax=Asticcacaulis sp. AC460 TaxID=1282360 RepID=UPI0003C3E5AE|nr:M23 family metallopeptidase [Asticcacaulis sp. AC460]ESQ92137.1 hypothetical protein ABAC460_04420 [Asticcacaulis sp. AC460]